MSGETYLDYHATTPVDPRVLEAMWPYVAEKFGNASSCSHAVGRDAARAVEVARTQIATFIGTRAEHITFTGGATESNNLALKGVVRAQRDSRAPHIVTVVTEHPSVLATCDALEREGCAVTRLPVRPDGLVELDELRRALQKHTLLVSVMLANNEIGVLQPIAEIAHIAHEAGALLHTDASQATGKIPVNAPELGVDLMSFTAHKMYGPKGVGALYVHPGVRHIEPLVHGCGHERGLRSGTLNVPAIVGFGVAAAVAMAEVEQEVPRIVAMRDQLLAGLLNTIPDLRVNGSMATRLPHNLNVSVPGVDAKMLGPALDDLAVSSGSAGSSRHGAPSHILSALGIPADLARASIRFGLGRWTAASTISHAIERVTRVVIDLRGSATRAALGEHQTLPWEKADVATDRPEAAAVVVESAPRGIG
jgi:cysteine desulfurase